MVYCGGLENRFGLTANGGSNPSLSASLRLNRVKAGLPRRSSSAGGLNRIIFRAAARRARKTVNELTKILIWAAVIGALFAYLWWQGQIRRFALYIQETREELKKCSWPTWQELKGSTVVIAISIALLGVFCVAADEFLFLIIFKLLKL